MHKERSYLIVGNGITGVTAAETLRAEDASCSITIIANELYPVYYRPALKDYLVGRVTEEKLWARPSTFYQQQRIRFIPGQVEHIAPREHLVQLADGQQLPYHKLLLAHGAHARRLTCPGADLAGVSTLRTIEDYQQIRQGLTSAKRVLVYGSGPLALESVEMLQREGYHVIHMLRHHTLWQEVLDQTASDLVMQEEQHAGIELHTNEEISEISGRRGHINAVITSTGARIACDLLLIAIGIEANIDLIRSSGITHGYGIRVDKHMQTSAPDIYAAGDAIEVKDQATQQPRLLGQWYPALEQARTAAYSMLNRPTTPPPLHTFYNATFLYGLDFVSIGLTKSIPALYSLRQYAELIAPPQARTYRKVLLKDGVPIGALFLGDRKNALAFKRAMDHRVSLQPIANQLFADHFKLDEWLDYQQVPPAHFTTINPLAVHQISSKPLNPKTYSNSSFSSSHSSSQNVALTPSLTIQTQTSTIGKPLGSQTSLNIRALTGTLGQPVTTLSSPNHRAQLASKTSSSLAPSSMLASLVPIPHPAVAIALTETPLTQHTLFTIGRQPAANLLIEHKSVSRLHAQITWNNGLYLLQDMGSSNGTFVNTVRLMPGATHVLQAKDRLRFGDVRFSFQIHSPLSIEQTPARKTLYDTSASLPVVGLTHRVATQAFTAERVHFEIDMCIGCDRCMAVCPIPMSSTVNISDLNAATLNQHTSTLVERFARECILCGSCVPVCPVDNHRDLLLLALKQRLGTSWEDPVDQAHLNTALPPGWTVQRLLQSLREQYFLSNRQQIPDNYVLHLFLASRLLPLEARAFVIQEGEYGRDLYLILDGSLTLSSLDINERDLPFAIMHRGECVGEYGMLTGQPHTLTARIQSSSLILQVPEQAMQQMMELVPEVRHFFEQLNNARSIASILKRMYLFQGIADHEIQNLVEQAQAKVYDRNERLFSETDRQGTRPARESLHVILEGFVKVARSSAPLGTGLQQSDEYIIAYRQGGDYFAGGLDLLGDGGAVTVTTITRTRVVELPRHSLLALFQRYPEVNQRFASRLLQYVESTKTAQLADSSVHKAITSNTKQPLPPPGSQTRLHALVNNGVVEGTEVLVIDLNSCIHCAECEEACARRHGHSRLNRTGMIIGNISITTACRQCQDPVCMLCSRAGIARRPTGEVFITESCIGCGICAERCPYGAISIVDAEDEPLARASWQHFNQLFTKKAEKVQEPAWKSRALPMATGKQVAMGPLNMPPPHDGLDELRKKIAIKCDLCAGYNDQACVQACPTGAAFRVQPTSFFGSTEDLLR